MPIDSNTFSENRCSSIDGRPPRARYTATTCYVATAVLNTALDARPAPFENLCSFTSRANASLAQACDAININCTRQHKLDTRV